MDKVYDRPPWWSYFTSIGFILVGVYYLRLWKKYRKEYPQATFADKAITEWNYLTIGLGAGIGGITFLIIEIYQACTGWIAK
jgi:hypothetical protein